MTYEELTPYERTLINEVVIPQIRIGVGVVDYQSHLENRVQDDCFKYNYVPIERHNCQQGANKIYDRIRLYLIDSGIAELRMGTIILEATPETHELRKAGSIEKYNEIKETESKKYIMKKTEIKITGDVINSNLGDNNQLSDFSESKIIKKSNDKNKTNTNSIHDKPQSWFSKLKKLVMDNIVKIVLTILFGVLLSFLKKHI